MCCWLFIRFGSLKFLSATFSHERFVSCFYFISFSGDFFLRSICTWIFIIYYCIIVLLYFWFFIFLFFIFCYYCVLGLFLAFFNFVTLCFCVQHFIALKRCGSVGGPAGTIRSVKQHVHVKCISRSYHYMHVFVCHIPPPSGCSLTPQNPEKLIEVLAKWCLVCMILSRYFFRTPRHVRGDGPGDSFRAERPGVPEAHQRRRGGERGGGRVGVLQDHDQRRLQARLHGGEPPGAVQQL